ncbi:MAG: hypothetical protein OEZ29_07920 [Candidatus Bathyarchaeota archaeon]|nr:hypothetical protein [Candidatus Bathyarchaeota archaeon]
MKLALKRDYIIWELDKFYAIIDFGVIYVATKPSSREPAVDEDYSY